MEGTQKGRQDIIYGELLENLVGKHHPYRKILKHVDFDIILKHCNNLYGTRGRPSFPLVIGFKTLLLQYWEDLSDRELERYLQENLPAKLFCGFALVEKTPDHSYFGRLRKLIGTDRLAELFNSVVGTLEKQGLVGNVFHFVDASKLLAKVNLWEARDKAITDKENDEKDDDGKPKMNNKNIKNYSSDKDARFGCKGEKNFFFGYKRNLSVDMRFGIITKAHISQGNVSDHKVLLEDDLLPEQGMIFMDKGYDCHAVDELIRKKGLKSAVIRKNNRKDKNRDLDRWRTSVRMPFESVFSKMKRETRYRGVEKVQFQNLMECLVYNFKKLIKYRSHARAS